MRGLPTLLCLSLLIFGATPLARAQSGGGPSPHALERAKKLFEDGVDLEKKADYAGALARYKDAEQIAVTAGLLFHEAYCLEMTGKLASALEHYDAADKLAREQNKQDVHTAILVRVDPLRPRVPQLAIRVAIPAQGAEVQLDGVTVAPLFLQGKSLRVDPGEHTVAVRAAGYRDLSRRVQAPESVTTAVDVSLERVSDEAPAAALPPSAAGADALPPSAVTEPPSDAAPRRDRVVPIVTTGSAILLAGAGALFFVVADGAQSDGQRDCVAKTTCDDEQTRVRTFDALALASFVGAAGLGVVSYVLWTSKPKGSSAATASVRSAPRARVIATPTSVGMEATF